MVLGGLASVRTPIPRPLLRFPTWQLPVGLAAGLPAASMGGVFDFRLLLLLRQTVSCIWAVTIMRHLPLFPAHLAFAAVCVGDIPFGHS